MPKQLLTSLIAAGALIASGLAATAPASADPAPHPPNDPTARVAPGGRVYYVDPGPRTPPPAAPRILPRESAQAGASSTPPALSSLKGSRRTIHLDFDGRNVTGEDWEANGITGFRSGFNLEGSASTFSAGEVSAIREIWERVAEVYAPFDVNVTTVDPGTAAINRSGTGDQNFGVRVVITHDPDPHNRICGGGCAGVAFVGVFDESGADDARTGWVFPAGAFNDPALIAHSASHEAGHTLGLSHDGIGLQDYYYGTPTWGPIMGGASGSAVVQFSRGDYHLGATNREDDLAIIAANGLSLRPDIGNTPATAHDLGTATSYSYAGRIGSRTDVDVVRFAHSCAAPITVSARGPARGQTLDIGLRLLDRNGVLASADPAAVQGGTWVAAGMDASLTATPTTGPYYLEVDGVAAGIPPNGWTDYGSIGSYTLSIGGCAGTTPGPTRTAPSQPRALKAAPRVRGAALTWTAPASAGSSPITGYRITIGGISQGVTASTRSVQVSGLADNRSYAVAVRAFSADGVGPAAATTVRTPARPGRPPIRRATPGTKGGSVTATARWGAAAANRSAVTGYQVRATLLNARNKPVRHRWSAKVRPGKRALVMRLPKGRYQFRVVAINRVGKGALSAPSRIVTAR